MIRGRAIAARGAAALNDWLVACSGVPQLHSALAHHLGVFAGVQRAGRIIRELDLLAYNHPARDRIRGIVDQLRLDPALHTAVLFEHLQAMLEADPVSPVTGELRCLVERPTAAGKLVLPLHATVDQVRSEAIEKCSWAHTKALSTMTAAEDAAPVVLIRTYGMFAA